MLALAVAKLVFGQALADWKGDEEEVIGLTRAIPGGFCLVAAPVVFSIESGALELESHAL